MKAGKKEEVDEVSECVLKPIISVGNELFLAEGNLEKIFSSIEPVNVTRTT